MRVHQPKNLAGKRNAGTTWLKLASMALAVLLSVASPRTHAQTGGVVSDTIGILFLVTTLDDHDDGECDFDDCTLREAIDLTNARAGHDGIRFGVTGTINLQSELPPIFDDLTIDGPGADLLTVRRDTGGDYRIFTVTVPAMRTVTLANMTIRNGFLIPAGHYIDDSGGGIYAFNPDPTIPERGTLNIINCTVSDNHAWTGGGVFVLRANLNVTNSTFMNNSAEEGGGGSRR